MFRRFIAVILLSAFTCASLSGDNLKLWYDEPASVWVEALPIGNGRIGAMIFGSPARERLQLNEETIWSGGPGTGVHRNVSQAIDSIRSLIFDGQYREAQELADKEVFHKTSHGMAYQPLGDLFLEFPGHDDYSEYYRELDISEALSKTSYSVGNVRYVRETFVSLTDDALVMRLTASGSGNLSFMTAVTSPQRSEVSVEDGMIVLRGTSGDLEGVEGKVRFTTHVRVVTEGGSCKSTGTAIEVTGADEACIYVTAATSFVDWTDVSADPDQRSLKDMTSVVEKDYEVLKGSHVSAYKELFDRVSLDVGITEAASAPTDERLRDFASGNDPQLVELYFQFGRYLLISSSQPGGQPANLQGIWNDSLYPPWDSKYTTNINAQMNYWPAEVTNLSELHEPLLTMIEEVALSGRRTASEMYGCRGWVLHHNTDIWRITYPVDAAAYGMWPTGGAWMCRHLWEHYLYTGDEEFLAGAYALMKGAALFFLDYMVCEPGHGWLVTAPSTSPENAFMYDEGAVTVCAGPTMDVQIISELFTNTISASRILKMEDKAFTDSLVVALTKMPPMQIGRYGQLQEWLHDWDRPDDHHRHVSHLYGLFPGCQISRDRTPELFDAARKSLNFRGDPATGWSMGWKVCLWARLLDGNRAYKLITDQLTPTLSTDVYGRGGTYPNLFDAHPPFQIDGNFGCTAGIAEMLLQSHEGVVHVLPALPDKWADGKATGLVARGGFVVDVSWQSGNVVELKVLSRIGGRMSIRCNDILYEVETEAGNEYTLRDIIKSRYE